MPLGLWYNLRLGAQEAACGLPFCYGASVHEILSPPTPIAENIGFPALSGLVRGYLHSCVSCPLLACVHGDPWECAEGERAVLDHLAWALFPSSPLHPGGLLTAFAPSCALCRFLASVSGSRCLGRMSRQAVGVGLR